MIIFSNAPFWARNLYQKNPDEFWSAYLVYVKKVLSINNSSIKSYQLWNEANHFIDPIKPEDDFRLFQIAGEQVKTSHSESLRFVNVLANLPGWQNHVDAWISKAGESFDVIAIDHYPGTWTPFADNNWYPLDILISRINDPNDLWYGKQAAVIETGFSSWFLPIASEARQARWMEKSLPAVLGKIRLNNRKSDNKVLALGVYQLVDTCSQQFKRESCHGEDLFFTIGIEAHFGLLNSDYSEKLAFNEIRRILSGE